MLADDPENGRVFAKRHAATLVEAEAHLRALQGKTFVNCTVEAKLSSNSIGKLLSNKAREKSNANGFSNQEHYEAAANIDRLFENAVLAENREDWKGSPDILSIKRYIAPFYTIHGFVEAYITLKELRQAGHRIYSLELDELKKPSDATGGSLGRGPRQSDGTLPGSVADTTKQYPESGSYDKLLAKTEKARALLEKMSRKNPDAVAREILGDKADAGLYAARRTEDGMYEVYYRATGLPLGGRTLAVAFMNLRSQLSGAAVRTEEKAESEAEAEKSAEEVLRRA